MWQLSPAGSRKCITGLKHVHWAQLHISDIFWKGSFCIKFLPTQNPLMCAFFASACEYQKPCNMVVNAFFIYFKYFSLWTCLDHFYCSVFKFHWRLSSASSLQLSPYSETFISEIVIFSSRSFIRFFFLYFYFSFQYDHNSFSFWGIFVINI